MNASFTLDHIRSYRLSLDVFDLTALKDTSKTDRILLKGLFLIFFHTYISEYFKAQIESELAESNYISMECYVMDAKITQLIIREILDTGQYTLEGIAHYTRIPLDVVLDAACGNNYQISITSWIRIVNLYMEVKPEVPGKLCEKLFHRKDEYGVVNGLFQNE